MPRSLFPAVTVKTRREALLRAIPGDSLRAILSHGTGINEQMSALDARYEVLKHWPECSEEIRAYCNDLINEVSL